MSYWPVGVGRRRGQKKGCKSASDNRTRNYVAISPAGRLVSGNTAYAGIRVATVAKCQRSQARPSQTLGQSRLSR